MYLRLLTWHFFPDLILRQAGIFRQRQESDAHQGDQEPGRRHEPGPGEEVCRVLSDGRQSRSFEGRGREAERCADRGGSNLQNRITFFHLFRLFLNL